MKSKISVLLAVFALIAATLACSVGGGELSLDNVHLSTTSDGAQTVTTFAPTDTFYVVADLNNAVKGTKVEAKWFVVNVPDYESGEIKSDTKSELAITDDSFSGSVNFSLGNTGDGWPAGDYKVEVYLDGQLKQSLNFSVK